MLYLIRIARRSHCRYWGKKLKPVKTDKTAPDWYWEKLREAIRKHEDIIDGMPMKHAELLIRLSIGTNSALMNGLTSKYRIWKQ